jgi:hypothetical protein
MNPLRQGAAAGGDGRHLSKVPNHELSNFEPHLKPTTPSPSLLLGRLYDVASKVAECWVRQPTRAGQQAAQSAGREAPTRKLRSQSTDPVACISQIKGV